MTTTPGPDTPRWLSMTALAETRGENKSTISRNVRDLNLETRPGPGRILLVNADDYEKAIAATTDAIRSLAVKGPIAAVTRGGAAKNLAYEQARRTASQADLVEMERDERLGKLLPIQDVGAAVTEVMEALLLVLEQLPSRAGEFAAAVTRDGPHGAKACLKGFVFDLRTAIARGMVDLAAKGMAPPRPPS